MQQLSLLHPFIQLGFAGFAFVQLVLFIWVVRWLADKVIAQLKISNDRHQEWAGVVAGNTRAIEKVHDTSDASKQMISDLRDQLLARPCLLHTCQTMEKSTP